MTTLIIRPAPSCYELVNRLHQAEIKALAAPLLSFSEGKDLPFISSLLNKQPRNSVVLAVSPRAIEYTSTQMKMQKFPWPKNLKYVAVGQKTAQAWESLCGIKASIPAKEDSEGLLAMRLFSNPKDLHIIILRGNNGRTLFGDTMAEKGSKIRYLETYQRHWEYKLLPSLVKQWRNNDVNTLIITSGEQLSLLCQTIPSKDLQWLKDCHILVPSKRIYNQAISLNFNKISCVDSASNHTLFNALKKMHKSGQSDDRPK